MTNLLSKSLVGLFLTRRATVIGFFKPSNLIKCELDCAIFLFDDWAYKRDVWAISRYSCDQRLIFLVVQRYSAARW